MALTHHGTRRRYRLAVLVLTAVTLLTMDFRDFGPLGSVQQGARDVMSPVRRAVDGAVSPVTDRLGGLGGSGDLRAENERLRAELEQVKGDALRDEADARSYRALRQELDIDYLGDIPQVAARVTSGLPGNFSKYFIEIDRGENAGLRPDMPVITRSGLVGRIARVDGDRAVVRLLTDPGFGLAVRIDDQIVPAAGIGDQRYIRAKEGFDPEREVEVGTVVLTAGGPLSKFPADIPVGRVATVDRSPGGLAQTATIELAADLRSLDFVSVLLFTQASS